MGLGDLQFSVLPRRPHLPSHLSCAEPKMFSSCARHWLYLLSEASSAGCKTGNVLCCKAQPVPCGWLWWDSGNFHVPSYLFSCEEEQISSTAEITKKTWLCKCLCLRFLLYQDTEMRYFLSTYYNLVRRLPWFVLHTSGITFVLASHFFPKTEGIQPPSSFAWSKMLFAFRPCPNKHILFGRHGWDLQILLEQVRDLFIGGFLKFSVAGMFLELHICDIIPVP